MHTGKLTNLGLDYLFQTLSIVVDYLIFQKDCHFKDSQALFTGENKFTSTRNTITEEFIKMQITILPKNADQSQSRCRT